MEVSDRQALKASLFAFGLTIAALVLGVLVFSNLAQHIGLGDSSDIVASELSLKPTDSVEVVLGGFLLDGKEGTLFGQWKDQDQVYLKVKVDF